MMVNNHGQEQEQHHSMYPQTMVNHGPLPPSLQTLLLSSSSLPHSYFMYQPSTVQQLQQHPHLPAPLSPISSPPPQLPLSIGCNTTHQQNEQCVNGCGPIGITNL